MQLVRQTETLAYLFPVYQTLRLSLRTGLLMADVKVADLFAHVRKCW